MQNKFLYQLLCVGLIALNVSFAYAQSMDDDFLLPTQSGNMDNSGGATTEVTPDLAGKKAVDFPSRSSLDTLELAPLPGIYETNISGPAPMAPSVSVKDMPSERLLGRLTPEVFQEMAELERDATFLKLQIQKQEMENNLEKVRSNYRQARLDEIAKREDVVRTRIQWWQEQEKIRQDMEAQRAAAEAAKNAAEEAKAAQTAKVDNDDIPDDIEEAISFEETEEVAESVEPVVEKEPTYALLGIQGIRDTLTARIKNIESGKIATIQVGDKLKDGSTVDAILPTSVRLLKQGNTVTLSFDD